MNEKGQGIVEFAIILVIVALVMMLVLLLIAPTGCGCIYSNIVTSL